MFHRFLCSDEQQHGFFNKMCEFTDWRFYRSINTTCHHLCMLGRFSMQGSFLAVSGAKTVSGLLVSVCWACFTTGHCSQAALPPTENRKKVWFMWSMNIKRERSSYRRLICVTAEKRFPKNLHLPVLWVGACIRRNTCTLALADPGTVYESESAVEWDLGRR